MSFYCIKFTGNDLNPKFMTLNYDLQEWACQINVLKLGPQDTLDYIYLFIGNMKKGPLLFIMPKLTQKHILNDGFGILHASVIESEFFNAPSF